MLNRQSKFLLIGLIIVSITIVTMLPNEGLFFPSIRDSSHVWVFFLSTLVLFELINPRLTSKVLCISIVGLAALTIGVAIEIVQPYFGRHKSLIDIFYDFIGIVSASVFWYRQFAGTQAIRFWLLCSTIVLLLSSFIYPATRLYALAQQEKAMPILANFDRVWEHEIVRANSSTILTFVDAPSGWENITKVAKIEFGTQSQYPGISFPFIYENWSGYDLLELDVYSAQDHRLSINIKVQDRGHNGLFSDRFNKLLWLDPGLNHIQLRLLDILQGPRQRELKLDEIESLTLFISMPSEIIDIFVDNIKLSP